jgi:NRPS condensation-like uncharacterized protein
MVIAGIIDQNKFDLAINYVCKRHPLLNCSIEIDKNHEAWFVQNTNSIEVEYYKKKDWKDWYKIKDSIPFDFLHGPLAKICVIDSSNRMEIIILGHHIIGDGIGYLNLAGDILLALDNKLEIEEQIPPNNNKFKKGKKLGFLSKLYAKKLNAEWKKNRVSFSENDYHVFFEQYRNKFIPEIYIDSVDEIGLKKIIKKCNVNNLTVNELITSAFSTSMIELSGNYPDKQIRIGVAASTRNELITKPYYCMGDYVTGISVIINYLSENGFITNAQNISEIIRKQLTNLRSRHLIVNFLNAFDTDLVESIMFASYGNYQLPISKKIGDLIGEGTGNKGLGISNLGRHEFNNYNTIKLLNMQFIGPAFPANLLSVSIITVNNRLNICLRYNKTELKDDVVEKIYKRTIELLLQ